MANTQNGIDISNHQASMNLGTVLDKTKTDFVICKATEGTSFVDKYCNGFISIAEKYGKQFGFYDFARPEKNKAVDEAKFFLKHTRGFFNKGIPVLDWESSDKWNVAWAKTWLDYVYKETGVKPVIYMSESVVNAYNWKSVADAGYGLWVAKYRDYSVDRNYDMSTAGKKPVVKWWKFYMMWQWTSVGRLTGYSGNLDCDIFYGDDEAWKKYVNSAEISTGGVEVDKIYAYTNLVAELPILREGATGNAVRFIQLLTGANQDGVWGPNTNKAVKAWQAKYKVEADGLFDKPDWQIALDWLATTN